MASFTPNVMLLSAIGEDKELLKKAEGELSGELKLEFLRSEKFSTIKKQYFLTKNEKREEYRKIFAINNLPEIPAGSDRQPGWQRHGQC